MPITLSAQKFTGIAKEVGPRLRDFIPIDRDSYDAESRNLESNFLPLFWRFGCHARMRTNHEVRATTINFDDQY